MKAGALSLQDLLCIVFLTGYQLIGVWSHVMFNFKKKHSKVQKKRTNSNQWVTESARVKVQGLWGIVYDKQKQLCAYTQSGENLMLEWMLQ